MIDRLETGRSDSCVNDCKPIGQEGDGGGQGEEGLESLAARRRRGPSRVAERRCEVQFGRRILGGLKVGRGDGSMEGEAVESSKSAKEGKLEGRLRKVSRKYPSQCCAFPEGCHVQPSYGKQGVSVAFCLSHSALNRHLRRSPDQ